MENKTGNRAVDMVKLLNQEPQRASLTIRTTTGIKKCLCCGRKQFSTFERTWHLGLELQYQVCRYCGLVFMSPRFNESDLSSFYKAEYRALYCGDIEPTTTDIEEQKARAKHLAQIVKSHVGRVNSHLDIGCSTGELLLAIKSIYPKVRVAGIEPSNAHRTWCSTKGLLAYNSLEVMLRKEQRRFQLVSLSHVLEHLPEPVSYLSKLRSDVIAPNGFLLIEAPNLLGHVSFEIAHLVCFYEKTLRDILRLAGYKLIFLKVHGIPRKHDARSQRYLTAIATPVPNKAIDTRIYPTWWRMVKLLRIKGLSGYSWPQFALRGLVKTAIFAMHKFSQITTTRGGGLT